MSAVPPQRDRRTSSTAAGATRASRAATSAAPGAAVTTAAMASRQEEKQFNSRLRPFFGPLFGLILSQETLIHLKGQFHALPIFGPVLGGYTFSNGIS